MEKLPKEILEYEQTMKNIIESVQDVSISDKELENECENTYIKFQPDIGHTYSDFEKSWTVVFRELKEKRPELYKKMIDEKIMWFAFR